MLKRASTCIRMLLLFTWGTQLPAQTFPCDGSFYLSTSEMREGPSTLYRLHAADIQSNTPMEKLFELDRSLSCLAYRTVDQHLYALDKHSKELLKIDANGQVTVFPPPEGLDTRYHYFAAEITPIGKRMIVVGNNPDTGFDEVLYSIRLDRANHIAGQVSIQSETPVQIGDIALDPVYGLIYGFDAVNQKVISVSWLTGQTAFHRYPTMPRTRELNALFFDKQGRLFGFGKTAGGGLKDQTFFLLDQLSGEVSKIGGGHASRITDGCSCAYSVRLNKRVPAGDVAPCSQARITYELINHAGESYPFIRLLDSLPPALRIVSVDHQPPVSELIQGPGGHVLEVMLTDMLLGTDSVVITVEVPPEAQGSYASQASLRAFPPAIGFRIASDDPATETPEDASSLAVSNLMVELGEARYVCAGEQLLLKPAVQPPSAAVSYQWSNGSTQPELLVQQTGWYSLQVQDGCARATDSVYVEVAPALPRLELGPDRFILQGESLQLSFETDVNGPAQLEWSVSNETPLSCYDCPMPQIRPLEHSQVFLRLRDEHGCAALDSMRIWVNAERDIFVANVLTPNGDGINDVFYVQGRGLGEVQQLAVFDRWGKLVFSGRGALNDPAHGWNGQHPQGAAPEGVYFWQLDLRFPDGRQQLLRGVVNLFR